MLINTMLKVNVPNAFSHDPPVRDSNHDEVAEEILNKEHNQHKDEGIVTISMSSTKSKIHESRIEVPAVKRQKLTESTSW